MYIDMKVCMFTTHVEPLSSGNKTFTQSEIDIDINEFHKCLNDDARFVVVCNDVSKFSDSVLKQYFIITDKLVAEEGFDDTFIMSHYGRGQNITNRKYKISILGGENPTLKATYYSS